MAPSRCFAVTGVRVFFERQRVRGLLVHACTWPIPPGRRQSCVSGLVAGHSRCLLDAPLPQDAVSFKAEPQPTYSVEAADYREAGGQQGLAYAPDAVYEAAEAPGHYQAGMGSGVPATPPSASAPSRERPSPCCLAPSTFPLLVGCPPPCREGTRPLGCGFWKALLLWGGPWGRVGSRGLCCSLSKVEAGDSRAPGGRSVLRFSGTASIHPEEFIEASAGRTPKSVS